MTLTTTDLIKTVAETVFPVKGKKTAKASRESFEKGKLAVEGILSGIKAGLTKGEHIRLVGFGTFDVRQVPKRQGRNPRTGDPIFIKAKKRISFSAGKILKNTINAVEPSTSAQEDKANQKNPNSKTIATVPKKKK